MIHNIAYGYCITFLQPNQIHYIKDRDDDRS